MPISAKKLQARYGTSPVTIVGVNAWDVTTKVDELDGTTGADAGFARPEAGVKELSGTINGYFDLTTGVGAAFQEGTTLTTLRLFRTSDDTTPAYSIPSALILSYQQKGEVRGRIEWTIQFKAVGSWTYADPS